MTIIRDIYKSGNLVEPLTRNEHIAMLNRCYRNAKYPNGTIDYKLVELGMSYSCDSSTRSDRHGSSSDSFSPSFISGNKNLMVVFGPISTSSSSLFLT